MPNLIDLAIEPRPSTGKGAAGRMRKEGRVPAVLYGYQTEPTAVSLDYMDLYHALHTPAGTNVLLTIVHDGDTKLCVARDIQRHPVKGEVQHLDLLAVDKDATIYVEVPVHLVDEPEEAGGVINLVLGSVPILVPPLNTPNYFELSVAGMVIGDVKRVEDLTDQLPDGATWDIDPERTVVTVNPPDILEEPEDEDEEGLLTLEGEEPGEGEEPAEGAEGAEGESSED